MEARTNEFMGIRIQSQGSELWNYGKYTYFNIVRIGDKSDIGPIFGFFGADLGRQTCSRMYFHLS